MKFTEFLTGWKAHESVATEDVLACYLPLLREVIATHELGMVAPLESAAEIQVDMHRLWYEESKRLPPRSAIAKISYIESNRDRGWDVVSRSQRDTDWNTGESKITSFDVAPDGAADAPNAKIEDPLYFPRYIAWEHTLGHHDPLTDVFSLGMILASVALQLDFHDEEALNTFVANRHNLFALNRELHPVLAHVICQMTELYRKARPQDLRAVLRSLENYRDQIVSLDVQLALDHLSPSSAPKSRTENILIRLRDRLFDVTRRNPLLHFRGATQALNLTQASMPLSIHIDNIREDQIMVWNDDLQSKLGKGKPIRLNQYINFNEAVYTSSVLERLMADSRRDKNEFGCSQLRLVVAYLGWANFKEKPVESFVSPLVLVPVQINKQKGIRDTFSFESLDSQAEVNPVIRHLFKKLYNIMLPETVDLNDSSLNALFQWLQNQIAANEPAITLKKIERPRIEVVHEKAKRRLDQYRRSARLSGKGVSRFADIDYSYDAINYFPLGVRLFTQRVRQPAFRLQQIVSPELPNRSYVAPGSQPKKEDGSLSSGALSSGASTGGALTVERKLAFLQDASEENPYHWTFDLCNLTLVNLHYRRMSLVRDYEAILENHLQNPAFEAAFAEEPKEVSRESPKPIPLDERFEVISSDPTQSAAIAESRTGECYIIQGPPGTGKSQTITNLIADFVSRSKRVLFVCEKRAAIDVVYARLKQSGLGSLCCLVHDSQADKKEFVLDLKTTYEQFTSVETDGNGMGRSKEIAREDIKRQMISEVQELNRFERAMEGKLEGQDSSDSLSVRELIDRCVVNRKDCPELTREELLRLPSFEQWNQWAPTIERIEEQVARLIPTNILSSHPLRLLRGDVLKKADALETIQQRLSQTREQLDQLERAIRTCGIPFEQWNTFERIDALLGYLSRVSPLARGGNLHLLDPRSSRAEQFRNAESKLEQSRTELEASREKNLRWRQKLTAEETDIALPQLKSLQSKWTRWLSPAWWRIRALLNKRYDFTNLAIRPTYSQILEDLQREHQAESSLKQATDKLVQEFQLPCALDQLRSLLSDWNERYTKLPAWLMVIHRALIKSAKAPEIVERCREVEVWRNGLRETLECFLADWSQHSIESLQAELRGVELRQQDVSRFADLLIRIDSLPTILSQELRTSNRTIRELKIAAEAKTLQHWLGSNPEIERFTSHEQATHVQRLEAVIAPWLASNAKEICDRTKEKFRERIANGNKDQAQFKRYQQGRKVLEHEFGKTMRYRAIRDLVDGDSGMVVQDLKPIWLMSPLSVSDTLPLHTQFVDVVIFDEASQVRLEESIPTLFRGVQTIIVGDTMQLPPTNFFSSRPVNEESANEDDLSIVESQTQTESFDLSSDSLLSHAGKHMASTMLGWHYRSRSESLISFSNWAFYDGRLLTVPDPRIALSDSGKHQTEEVASRGRSSQSSIGSRQDWLSHPLAMHYLEDGRYENRRNQREAQHIVELLAQWFEDDSGKSLGVIAFSEAQQSEIERAIEERASQDDAFRTRYEYELQREENGQFVGLLVKNLENIQGDERDIILLSVCYGPANNGKISMNFGPINRDGGEKRLNVAFTRAKQNMIVVSSLHYSQITNDFNTGPNCLKQYLRYVESISNMDMQGAQVALRQLSRWRGQGALQTAPSDPVSQQLSEALRSAGYCVDLQVGQSHFRIDIAVYCPGDEHYRLGILVDTVGSYRHSDPWERDVMRPRLLRDFGWVIHRVLGKDWYQDPDGQLREILAVLQS